MRRRNAIKKLGLVAGGIFLLPSCNFSEEKAAQVIEEFQINPGQKDLLKDLISSIIPKDNLPGAEDLKVENFVWIMLKETFDKASQTSFIAGLNQFSKRIEKENAKTFTELSQDEKVASLYELDAEIEIDDASDLRYFIDLSKKLTIQGYLQSQYIMTEIMPYQLVPGGHGNCEDVSAGKRINIYG
jgi:hypothetical protein